MPTSWSREPLLWFLIPALLIFAWHRWQGPVTTPPLVIAGRAVDDAVAARGQAVSEVERRSVVRELVTQEVLVQAALDRGMAAQDAGVRLQLAARMAFLLVGEPPEPSPEQLAAFLASNVERYHQGPHLTLTQVCAPDEATACAWRDALAAGASPDELGAELVIGRQLEDYPAADLAVFLGEDFVATVTRAATGAWIAPVVSTRGVHAVRVQTVTTGGLPALSELPGLAEDWRADWRRRELARQVDGLLRDRPVVFDDGVARPW